MLQIGVGARRRSASQAIDLATDGGVNLGRLFTAKDIAIVLASADVKERFQNIGLPVVAEGPDEFRARIAREVPMYKEAIDKAGLKIK